MTRADSPDPGGPKKADGFQVTGWVHTLGGMVDRHKRFSISLGNLESRLLGDAIADTRVDAPIYIAGLARSGSTILLETLAAHPDVATHRYRDYPGVFTPYWWNRWLDRVPQQDEQAAERSHNDGIKVTSESPEAFEEVLWMGFFPELHDPARSAVLDRNAEHPGFERFYRDHLRKLLAVRGRRRYVAKGNYNVTRLGYLQKLHADARFVVPVRDPVWHIASLMKQHALFLDGERRHPKALSHLQRVGHFEFGLDRRPINPSADAVVAEVQALWAEGREVAGWARYWALIHNHLLDTVEADHRLREAALILRFEALCNSPRATMERLLAHCDLPADDAFLDAAAGRIRFPSYYEPGFSPEDMATIRQETATTAARLGYPTGP